MFKYLVLFAVVAVVSGGHIHLEHKTLHVAPHVHVDPIHIKSYKTDSKHAKIELQKSEQHDAEKPVVIHKHLPAPVKNIHLGPAPGLALIHKGWHHDGGHDEHDDGSHGSW